MKPLGVLTEGKSHLSITQITKNVHFSSVFDSFLAPVAMATTETTKTTHEWTPTVKSFNMVPHLSWSDTGLKKWHIIYAN